MFPLQIILFQIYTGIFSRNRNTISDSMHLIQLLLILLVVSLLKFFCLFVAFRFCVCLSLFCVCIFIFICLFSLFYLWMYLFTNFLNHLFIIYLYSFLVFIQKKFYDLVYCFLLIVSFINYSLSLTCFVCYLKVVSATFLLVCFQV